MRYHFKSYEEAMREFWTAVGAFSIIYLFLGILGIWLYRNMKEPRFHKIFRYHIWVVFGPALLITMENANGTAYHAIGVVGGAYWCILAFVQARFAYIYQEHKESYHAYVREKVNALPIPSDRTLKKYETVIGHMSRIGQIYRWREAMFKLYIDPIECAKLVKEGKLDKPSETKGDSEWLN